MSRRIHESICQVLTEALSPSVLEVQNNSAAHAGHAEAGTTGETHFSILVVSESFKNQSKLQRHRMIYALLKEVIQKGVHAIEIKTWTSTEYQNL